MNNPQSDSESDAGTLSPIENYDTNEIIEDEKEIQYVQNVRNKLQDWKLREMDKNTTERSNAKGLQGLRKYINKSAKLFYDLNSYINTSKNNEKNMKDVLYVSIIEAIGLPGALAYQTKMLLQHILERDLVELPFTMNPSAVNERAQKGIVVQTQFPDEE
jgi:hypothetical protein